MKIILIVLSLFLFSLSLQAQKSGTIIGTIIDSLTKEPITQSTISIYKLSDSSLVSYSLSDNRGQFKIDGLFYSNSLWEVWYIDL